MPAYLVPRVFVLPLAVLVLVVAAVSRTQLSAASLSQDCVPVTASGNIRLAQVLVPVFDRLLQSSATFRRQVARIASAPYARIVVNAVLGASTVSRGTARTTMRRFSEGALLAYVEIPTPLILAEYARLFGHEFEHVIEQLERVNLQELAGTGAAARLGDGAYETIRARDAGLTVAREAQAGALPVPLSRVSVKLPAASAVNTPARDRQQ
jgi:hypothetical protein